MKRTPILTIWSLSLAGTLLFANAMNCIFWMSFACFALCSIYIEKHSERLEREEE